MAGKKGRSGRKASAEEAGLAEPGAARTALAAHLGELGTSDAEIVLYLGRVTTAYLLGLCTLTEAKELRDQANSAARILGRNAGRRELEELRAMLDEAKALELAGQARADMDRLHRSPDVTERARPPHRRDPTAS